MIEYTVSVKITEEMRKAERILFKIGSFNGCTSTVLINGRHAGYIDREPYTLLLDKDLLIADRDNEIKILLFGTFRNMFGPSHFVEYDPSRCSRATWYDEFNNTDFCEYDVENHTNSFQLIPYGAGDFSLEIFKLQ